MTARTSDQLCRSLMLASLLAVARRSAIIGRAFRIYLTAICVALASPCALASGEGIEAPGKWEDEEGSVNNCGPKGGPSPLTEYPIDAFRGTKFERAVDLSVSLPGGEFVWSREYAASFGSLGEPSHWPHMSGPGWLFPSVPTIKVTHEKVRYLGTARRVVGFKRAKDGAGVELPFYTTGGGSTQRMNIGVAPIGNPASPVLTRVMTLVDPGAGVRHFGRWFEDPGDPQNAVAETQFHGLLLQDEDVWGNRRVYQWFYQSAQGDFQGSAPARLGEVRCYDAAGTLVAKIVFDWILRSDTNETEGVREVLRGRLRSVAALRPDGASSFVETQRVEYRYFDDFYAPTQPGSGQSWVPHASTELGSRTDLVLVVRYERVDGLESVAHEGPTGFAYPANVSATHYRYPVFLTPPPGQYEVEHYLHRIVLPEQLEHYAQHANAQSGATRQSLYARAEALVTKSSVDTLWSEGGVAYKLDNITSKRIEYETSQTIAPFGEEICGLWEHFGHRVATEWVQGGTCGCGSGSGASALGLKLSYQYRWWVLVGQTAYCDRPYMRSTVITESIPDPAASGAYTPVRIRQMDFAMLGASPTSPQSPPIKTTPYLINDVVIDPLDTSKQWVTHYVYDDDRRLVRLMMPSATQSYSPEDSTLGYPKYVASPNSGLVHAFVYDTNNRLVEERVRQGAGYESGQAPTDLQVGAPADEFDIVERTVYGGVSTNERPHLPREVIRFRREGVRTASEISAELAAESGAHVERTWLSYGFRNVSNPLNALKDNNLAWVRTETEQDLLWENGPGTSESDRYRRVDLFDARGDNIWSIAEDNRVTRRTFQATTGEVETTIENAEWNGQAGSFANVTVDWGTGRNGDGGALQIGIVRDALGRITRTTTPGGVHSYVLRVMRDVVSRPGLSYLTEVTVPHVISAGQGEYSGPIVRKSHNASGEWIEERAFGVQSIALASGTVGGFVHPVMSYAINTSTLLRDRVTLHALSGAKTEYREYGSVATGVVHSTRYLYDGLGRLRVRVNANGTAERYTFDVHDRPITSESGTLTSSSIGDIEQSGTGNLRTVTQNYFDSAGAATQGVGDGTLTRVDEHASDATARTTTHAYDYRNRRTRTVNPMAPHEAVAYDNQNRPTQRAMFRAVPTDVGSPRADRGQYARVDYSQRGLAYRSALAVDPDGADSQVPTDGFIERHRWFDAAGRVVQEWRPNSPATKTDFDALGREIRRYTTDRGGDPVPNPAIGSSVNSFAHAYDTSTRRAKTNDDTVFEQVDTRYLSGGTTGAGSAGSNIGAADLMTTRKRAYDAVQLGDLSSPTQPDDVITTYVGYRYDAADRVVDQIDFGTNWNSSNPANDPSGQTPDRNVLRFGGSPPSLATPGSDARIWRTAYNARGLVDSETSPRTLSGAVPIVTKKFYDDLDRVIAVVENWKSGTTVTPTSSHPRGYVLTFGGSHTAGATDQDRATISRYDGLGNVVHLAAAHDSGSGAVEYQDTVYVYGVVPSGQTPPIGGSADSLIHSNNLLARVIYPDQSAGETLPNYSVAYGYNRQGELIQATDQNGVVHAYQRDALGRVTEDHASTIPGASGIDTKARKQVFTFDTLGRRSTAKSLDTFANVLNSVQYAYNDLWQVIAVTQNPTGDLGGAQAATVSESYDTQARSSGNRSRLSALTYPSALSTGASPTAFTSMYGAGAGSPDSLTSRITQLSWPVGLVAQSAVYTYLGFEDVLVKDYVAAGLRLDRTANPRDVSGGGVTQGRYPGLDRFGRVRAQTWLRSNWVRGSRPEVANIEYTYDAESNPTNRFDRRAEDRSSRVDPDERYRHDGLHRLTQADRGKQNHSTGSLALGGPRGQQWTLNGVGGWNELRVNLNGDADGSGNPVFSAGTDLFDARTYNAANEWLTQNVNSGGDLQQDHDKAGNLIKRRLVSGGVTATWTYVYDAWNRLVEVKVQPSGGSDQTRARYTYNALHWRATRIADSDQDKDTTPDEANLYYYDYRWRLLEERLDEDFATDWEQTSLTGFAPSRLVQRFWGPEHIDELIAFAASPVTSESVGPAALHYALTDRLFSVIGLFNPSEAFLKERIRYASYGQARHEHAADADGNGAVDFMDLNRVLGAFGQGYTGANYSVDADFDQSGIVDFLDLNLAIAFLSAVPEGFVADTFAAGGTGNTVGYSGYLYDSATGLYCVRHRWYSPGDGQWMSRDILIYEDGASLYAYVTGDPLSLIDPLGLMSWNDWKDTIKEIPGQVPGVIKRWFTNPWQNIDDADDGLKLIEDEIPKWLKPFYEFFPTGIPRDVINCLKALKSCQLSVVQKVSRCAVLLPHLKWTKSTKHARSLDTALPAVRRDRAVRKRFLKSLHDHPNTPKWMKPWLKDGRVPPGHEVDHTLPLSVGGPDDPSNMRLVGIDLHRLWHKKYRPWEGL